MKKKDIILTPVFLLFSVIFLIGLIVTGIGVTKLYRVQNAKNICVLSEEDIHKGVYVSGTIDAYLGYIYENGYYEGESIDYMISIWAEYHVYTIPISDGKYISILVDDVTKKELETYINGKGDTVFFEGKIIKSPFSINAEWLKDALHFKTEEEVSSVVSKDYMIKQISFENQKNYLIFGILLMILSSIAIYYKVGRYE